MVTQALRTAIFYIIFIGQTAICALIIGTVAIFVRRRTRFTWAVARYWCWSNLWILRLITGVRTKVIGEENIPPGGCIIASKHQSDWDVFAVFPHTGRPAYIVKQELMNIPFFGWAAQSLDCIAVDRSKGAEAMIALKANARAAIERGCRIVIFPEGTRRPPLDAPAYKFGTARLYEALNVPVVPVALNSGLFWGRNSLVIWPGTAEARFLPAIPPGLSPDELQKRLISDIETASDELILSAAERGLARPIPVSLREKLDGLAKRLRPDTQTSSAD